MGPAFDVVWPSIQQVFLIEKHSRDFATLSSDTMENTHSILPKAPNPALSTPWTSPPF